MNTRVMIKLNARLMPIHRGEISEDSLHQLLASRMPGSVVSGGGTMLSAEGEPRYSNIDVDLKGDPRAGLALIVQALQEYRVPKGSTVRVDGGEPLTFGATEGLALYLNGTDLPDEVYENGDLNELVERLLERLGQEGAMQSWWNGPRDTALYLYGGSSQRMRELIADLLATHPLAQRSRLVAPTEEPQA